MLPRTNDIPYIILDEDPFRANVYATPRRPRSSSRMNRWIDDQQIGQTASPEQDATIRPRSDDTVVLNDFDLVEDADIPSAMPDSQATTTPTSRRSWRASKFVSTPPSLRGLSLSFRSGSPATSQSPAKKSRPTSTPPNPSHRVSLLSRSPRQPPTTNRQPYQQHDRSASLGSVQVPQLAASKWRPSVLGHFTLSATVDEIPTPPRPSMSSGDTLSSTTATTTTTTENDMFMPPRLTLPDSIRSHNKSWNSLIQFTHFGKFGSTDSVRSQSISGSVKSQYEPSLTPESTPPATPALLEVRPRVPTPPKTKSQLSTTNVDFDLSDDEDEEQDQVPALRPQPTIPQVAYSSGSNRVSLSSLSSRKKKRKLVISGIAPNDTRRFEGVKRWCETFGEVNQITRMPNGDLHVHFRRADVADTVCRIRAQVHITGVGSVQLSWFTGDRR
ncbi:hypothetical protein BDN72DRAFT_38316 [Pluteus cervinus]|uniref:Uncharacterized protein n=1 Tax=Pluteus cervinus TaxID=181527 RepID=A0ACD3BHE8_9AGAR|nr:hypothetical protein BDN72DRAFT_38316 [Pluteus cervinus]